MECVYIYYDRLNFIPFKLVASQCILNILRYDFSDRQLSGHDFFFSFFALVTSYTHI